MALDRVVETGRRLLDLGAYQLSLGDTIGVGTPGNVWRCSTPSTPPARRTTCWPCTSTTPTARPCQRLRRADARRHDVRRERGRPGRLPVRRVGHRQPGHRGPGVDAARARHRDRCRSRRPGGDQPLARRPPRSSQPQPRGQRTRALSHGALGCSTMPPWPTSSTCTWVHPRPGPPTSRVGSTTTGTPWRAHGVHYPRAGSAQDMFVGALDLDRPALGGTGEEVRGEWDALTARVRRVSGTAIVSHEILASATAAPGRPGATPPSVTRRCTWSTPRATWAGRSPPSGRRASSTGSRRRFRGYVRLHPDRDQVDSDLWFWRVHSLPDVLGAGRATSRGSGSTSSPCRPRVPTRRSCGAGSARPAASTRASGSRSAGGPTPRWASRRSPCCVTSTSV